MSKIVAVFNVPDMTATSYRQVMRDLNASGAEHPPGRLSHLASNTEKGMIVVDTYDGVESLQRFGETLMPILVKNGVTPPKPDVAFIENEVVPPGKR